MKEVLFDFEEFMDRLDGSRSKVHSAYTRKDTSVYVSYAFRISFLEAPTLVVVYLFLDCFGDELLLGVVIPFET